MTRRLSLGSPFPWPALQALVSVWWGEHDKVSFVMNVLQYFDY